MTVLNVDRAELHRAWDEIAESGFYTEGKYVRLFEEQVERLYGMHAVAVNSCGSGLFALYRQFTPGQAIVPVNTFFATGAMAREAGHGIRLADCGAEDFSMSLESMIAAMTSEISMVVLTHVGGWLAKDYKLISDFCRARGLPLIEDAAHVFGTNISGLRAGSLGTAAVFSLYPTKAVPVGEGGVIVTKDALLAQALREFRNYGKFKMGDGPIQYWTGRMSGFNLRMDEWTAAVAWLQTRRIHDILFARHQAARALMNLVAPHPFVPKSDWAEWNNWYKYPVEASFPAKKTTGKIYQLSDQLPAALGMGGHYPNAEKLAQQHICLPIDEHMFAGMNSVDIEHYMLAED